jgi:hypothetical protein
MHQWQSSLTTLSINKQKVCKKPLKLLGNWQTIAPKLKTVSKHQEASPNIFFFLENLTIKK